MNQKKAFGTFQEQIFAKFPTYLESLKTLTSFAGVSAQGFESKPLSETANWLEQTCKQYGFSEVNKIQLSGAAPYLLATRFSARSNAPTVLIYAHYDVQPVGNFDLWQSPPFTPTIRNNRLYGRGTADDKAGIMAALAAIDTFHSAGNEIPVHVKLLLDGEEERGSPHIETFLKNHRESLKADYLIVPDMVNPGTDLPAIVFSLRGLIEFRVKISAAEKAIHSGLGGGIVPDPTQALALLYTKIIDQKGRVHLPNMGAPKSLSKNIMKSLQKVKIKESEFALLSQVKLLQKNPRAFYEAAWLAPALTLIHLRIGEGEHHANRIQPEVEGIFSLRLPPHVNPEKVTPFLKKMFTKNLPFGCKGEFEVIHQAQGFYTDPEEEFFQKALLAVSNAYQRRAIPYGAGLTIPFVYLLQKQLGKMKTILLGVEDPQSNAHAENESVDLYMFRKSIAAIANLLMTLA